MNVFYPFKLIKEDYLFTFCTTYIYYILSNNQNNLAINYVSKISSGHLYTKRDKTHK